MLRQTDGQTVYHYMDPHSAYYVDSASKDSVPVLRHADRTLGVGLGVALKAAATNTADLYQLPVPVHTAIVQAQVPVVQLPVPVHRAIVQLPVPVVQIPALVLFMMPNQQCQSTEV